MGSGPAPVAHMKLASAVTTPQQSDEQALARPCRCHRFVSLPVDGVATLHTLVFFVSGPVNIPHMMTGDEDPTFFRPTIRTLPLFKPAFYQQGLHRPPP